MRTFIQLIIGGVVVVGSLALLYLMATSELNFMDLRFAKFFSAFAILAAIGFFVITRNEDNEETNPGKEKARR